MYARNNLHDLSCIQTFNHLQLQSPGDPEARPPPPPSGALQNRHSTCMQVRMRAKNVIKGLVPWADARRTLATRLRRKLAEEGVRAHIASADPSIPRSHALELLQEWYKKSPQSPAAGGDSCMLGMYDAAIERSPTAVAASPLAARDDAPFPPQSEGTKDSTVSGATPFQKDTSHYRACIGNKNPMGEKNLLHQRTCMQALHVRSTSS